MNLQNYSSPRLRTVPTRILLMTLLLFSSSLGAQEDLRAVVEGAGAEWMVGRWTGTNSQGLSVSVEYEWELDGNALEIDLELGDTTYKGMIIREPKAGNTIEFGADSGGGATQATWRVDNGLIISERTGTRAGGRETKVAVIQKKIDADHCTATMHPLSSDGAIGAEALETVHLKRLPPDASKD